MRSLFTVVAAGLGALAVAALVIAVIATIQPVGDAESARAVDGAAQIWFVIAVALGLGASVAWRRRG